MSWNFRILAEDAYGTTVFRVAEVYYDAEGKPRSWSQSDFNPLAEWDELSEIRGTIELIQGAREKPVLQVVGGKLVEMEMT